MKETKYFWFCFGMENSGPGKSREDGSKFMKNMLDTTVGENNIGAAKITAQGSRTSMYGNKMLAIRIH